MIYTDGVHIVADTLYELHSWASLNGIKRHWFEGVKKGHPHYDCPSFFKQKLDNRTRQGIIKLITSKQLLLKSKKLGPTKIESEKVIEKHLRERVEKDLGGWCLKFPANFVAGLPDRICLFPGGRVAFVELKTTNKKPRKIQLVIHKKLRALGFIVEIIDTRDKVDFLIDSIDIL